MTLSTHTWRTSVWIGAAFVVSAFGAHVTPDNDNLVVHEWGTFTSVAGETGEPVVWAPLTETPDLPCFVERLSPQLIKAANALVRMETPVMYFYSQHATTLSVQVAFPQGWITEWYPQATRVHPKPSPMPVGSDYRDGQMSWDEVRVEPGQDSQFPVGQGASRYYAARNTDSAALTVGGQREKMIFYRGIGNFAIPLHARFAGQGTLEVRNTGSDAVPLAMLFENREGRIGYRLMHDWRNESGINPPELTASLDEVRTALTAALVENGLYPKEAAAMLATWQDSWFEQGSRLIYIVPRRLVDRLLPLTVSPAPGSVVRVFVGRIEVLSPAVRAVMETALATGQSAGLDPFGRFLEPFLAQIRRGNPGLVESPAARETLFQARTKFWRGLDAKCIP